MRGDDPFATGVHLAKASRHDYLFAWRRFLGFLTIHEPTALGLLLPNGSLLIASELFVLILRRRTLPDLLRVSLVRSTTPRG